MSKYYKEKHLQATIYKIENVKKEQNFLVKHFWKVIGFGILFSFWAPTRRPEREFMQRSQSLIEKGEYGYYELVVICALIYSSLALIYHFVSNYQDKRKLKKLTNLKTQLEKEIALYDKE